MPLVVHSWGSYATYSRNAIKWRDEDYQVNRLVHALKGDPFSGGARIRDIAGRVHHVTPANPERAFSIFGQWGARLLLQKQLQGSVLVPVPASSHTEIDEEFAGKRIAQAVSDATNGAVSVVAALAFQTAMTPARKGGTRDPEVIFENLYAEVYSLKRNVVLIDDVTTTGAHLKACARFLRDIGATVEIGLCAGRSTSSRVENPLESVEEDIEASPFDVYFEDES